MYFSEEDLAKLRQGADAIPEKARQLFELFIGYDLKTDRGREFAQNGFARRIETMARCIAEVFSVLPPEQSETPANEVLRDAEVSIQAFVFNVFGAADNLAWIWAMENDVRDEDGEQLAPKFISLRKKRLRKSLPPGFIGQLDSLDKWFGNLENYRHALAHRIPLYIPRYIASDEGEAAYRELEHRITRAILRLDNIEAARLSAEQKKLRPFRPWMMHSPTDKAKPIVFHPRLLSDFDTIDELGRKMLDEVGKLAADQRAPVVAKHAIETADKIDT